MKDKDSTRYQYQLISTYERDIEQPEVYNTHNQAFEAMVEDLARQTDDFSAWKLKKHFKSNTLEELDGYDDFFGLDEDWAWYNGNYNYDWKIVRLTVQNNRIIKCE